MTNSERKRMGWERRKVEREGGIDGKLGRRKGERLEQKIKEHKDKRKEEEGRG